VGRDFELRYDSVYIFTADAPSRDAIVYPLTVLPSEISTSCTMRGALHQPQMGRDVTINDEINILRAAKNVYNRRMNVKQGYLLIVEDDPDIRGLLQTALKFRDFRVATANNGKEALELVQREHPILVIADIMMPQLDGFGLVHRMRINPDTRAIPVVFITATYVAPEDKAFALRIGATRFIQKPVDLEVFLNIVKELIEQGPHTVPEPLDEFKFYDGYRERLEAKLDEKTIHIARDKHLLKSHPYSEDEDIQVSLRHAQHEQDELKILLVEIHKQLERIGRAE
jgi:DNA-binding response OmpR family regulator